MKWRVLQEDQNNRNELLTSIAEKFQQSNGYEIYRAKDRKLSEAISSLILIIKQHDRSKAPSKMPISQRVDMIIKSIVDSRSESIDLKDAELAALLCAIDLERHHQVNA